MDSPLRDMEHHIVKEARLQAEEAKRMSDKAYREFLFVLWTFGIGILTGVHIGYILFVVFKF